MEEDKELALSEVLSSILTDEDLSDVTLKGTDGVKVPAYRMILAARSKVFRQMLFGNFSESNSKVVELGYEGAVLKAIVEYVHTDSTELLDACSPKKRKRGEDEGSVEFSTQVPILVSLAAAAMYFNLSGLSQKVQDTISKLIEENPSWCFLLLEACSSQGPAVPRELFELAQDAVRNGAGEHVTASAVEGLSSSVLEDIIKDEKVVHMTEADLFNILRLWTEANPTDRTATAKKMTEQYIHLEQIDPVVLSSMVTSSGLVNPSLLLEAYKHQALSAQKELPHSFSSKLRHICWQNSRSKYTNFLSSSTEYENELLKCAPMASGIHKWTLKLTKSPSTDSVVFGMVATGIALNNKSPFEEQPYGWGVFDYGKMYHGSKEVIDRTGVIHEGKTVAFTLNLLPNAEGNGTLSVCVEGDEAKHVFSNMRESLSKYPKGFIPIVSGVYPAQVQVVSMERLGFPS